MSFHPERLYPNLRAQLLDRLPPHSEVERWIIDEDELTMGVKMLTPNGKCCVFRISLSLAQSLVESVPDFYANTPDWYAQWSGNYKKIQRDIEKWLLDISATIWMCQG